MPKDSRPLHLVYYSYHLDPRAGGPTGYLANLKIGLDKIPNPEDFSIWFLTGVAKKKTKAKIIKRQRYLHSSNKKSHLSIS